MSFAIFDENYYLENNPDVKAAVDAGTVKSGLQHFEQSGMAEGRVKVSPLYDEKSYLEANPDVAAAVKAGGLKSGLQHFIQSGEVEGRTGLKFDEKRYLQKYPDVNEAVATGAFKSGLQHFLEAGKNEGRTDTAFNEDAYLELNPDIAAAVKAGAFRSGFQHYETAGQSEDNRIALFSGTTGNDDITGFGEGSSITGIDLFKTDDARILESKNYGRGEVDTLTGGSGSDLFILGTASSFPGIPTAIPQSFYDGEGDADYAEIKNFEPGSDTIQIAGYQSFFYNLQEDNGNLKISTIDGDLIAVVDGVKSLSPLSGTTSPGTFQLG